MSKLVKALTVHAEVNRDDLDIGVYRHGESLVLVQGEDIVVIRPVQAEDMLALFDAFVGEDVGEVPPGTPVPVNGPTVDYTGEC